jgi:hypothetical protein
MRSAALCPQEMPIDEDELECLTAVLIHRKLIKGYISHRPLVLVVSKEKPFPRLSEVLGREFQ